MPPYPPSLGGWQSTVDASVASVRLALAILSLVHVIDDQINNPSIWVP